MKQRSNWGHFCPARDLHRAELGAVSHLSLRFPFPQPGILRDFVQPVQHRLFFNVVELLPAEVILPPFHQGYADVREQLSQERDVLEEELFLEVLGAG